MRHFAVVCCLLATPALAEQPERLVPDTAVSIGVGHTETFKFKSAFSMIHVASQGVVEAAAQSDHILTLYGKAEGVTTLTVRTDKGEEIYNAMVTVTTEPGHIVKIYGRRDIPDYTGFYCTATACGRADKELNGARELTSRSVTDPSGRTVTQTFGR